MSKHSASPNGLPMPAEAKTGKRPVTKTWPWAAAGGFVIALAFGGIGGWGATVPLASAVVTQGQVTVDTNRKQIQHLEGGIVSELNIRDGDTIMAGDVLMRLDDTRAKASLSIVEASYREETAKQARLVAERDRRDTIDWPQALRDQAEDMDVSNLLESQQAIFDSRRDTMRGEVGILNERIQQLSEEIGGLEAQTAATRAQVDIIEEELAGLITLFEKGQTTKPRILALQREKARLEGEFGELKANIARSRNAIGETKLEIIQKEKAFRSEVVATLSEVQAEVNDLRERYVAARDVMERLDIRAPVSGKVVNLTVHAQGVVIRPGETFLELVPTDDKLIVEVKVAPQDIDNVAVGQVSEIRMLAFKQRTTPTLDGAVSYVSADALTDPQDGATFYLARIHVPEDQLARLEGQRLQPGMPAEVMIRTGERTALAYLIQPILDSMNRAWRES